MQRLCAQRPLVIRHWVFGVETGERVSKKDCRVSCCNFWDFIDPTKKFLVTIRHWRYFADKDFPESPHFIFNLDLFFLFITSTCKAISISIEICKFPHVNPMSGTEWGYKWSEMKYAFSMQYWKNWYRWHVGQIIKNIK